MPVIGVRELRERTAEVLHEVRDQKAEYVITYQGRPIALLLPVDEKVLEEAVVQAAKQNVTGRWESYARTAGQVRQNWPAQEDTQELLDDIRDKS